MPKNDKQKSDHWTILIKYKANLIQKAIIRNQRNFLRGRTLSPVLFWQSLLCRFGAISRERLSIILEKIKKSHVLFLSLKKILNQKEVTITLEMIELIATGIMLEIDEKESNEHSLEMVDLFGLIHNEIKEINEIQDQHLAAIAILRDNKAIFQTALKHDALASSELYDLLFRINGIIEK